LHLLLSFDITPAKYIAGIVTEKGVIRPDPKTGQLNVKAFVAQHSDYEITEEAPAYDILHVPEDYVEQTTETLPLYIFEQVPKAMQVLRAKTVEDLECVEVGDGNLNLVFIVSNKNYKNDESQKVIVKQSLPYVRCVGTSWPLTLERAYFEYEALVAEKAACPEFVPDLYHFSKHDAIIVMQYIAPPNIILRKGLIQGIRYPTMASDMGKFCAKTLFKTSGLCLSATALREKVQFWSKNTEMCALTEQVVFTEPYIQAPNNRWTSPQLDEDKKAIENDIALKVAAAGWKEKFVTQTQALIHADLHTGSVMCSPADHQTFVIDPEFAFYGPAGFDTGAFVANLFLSYVSQEGHRPGEDYAEWVLDQIQTFWTTFEDQFLLLWDDPHFHTGFLYGRDIFKENSPSEDYTTSYMKSLLTDTLGFAGMKMLRRIVGIAHVEDLESIEDADVRAKCERRGLNIAKTLIQNAASFGSIHDVIDFARKTAFY
jgi:5-methylthioribose kinase